MERNTLHPKINAILFVFILFIVGILFFILPKNKISQNERRALAIMPNFSINNLFDGSLMDSLDSYYSDNFIFRDNLITLANTLNSHRGFGNNEVQIFEKPIAMKNKMAIKNKTDLTNKIKTDSEIVLDSILMAKKDTSQNIVNESDQRSPQDYENIKSVLIHKKRAIQLFGGRNIVARQFAAMVNRYKKELGLNIYVMAIPIGFDFNIPASYTKKNTTELAFINYLYGLFDSSSIKTVQVYQELKKHKNEYIYFNTDHHWTGLGALYGYQAFCNAAGFVALPTDSLKKRVIHHFLGSLYYYTLSQDLKDNIDSVEYFKIPNKTRTYYYNNDTNNAIKTTLYVEKARGGNSYGVFLGSDYPLMRVVSNIKNNKKVLVIKDSYGNAFSPFMPAHYQETFILDYRYFNGKIKDIIAKFGITDIIFAHNVFVLNNIYTVKRETFMLNYSKKKRKIILKDTLQKK